MTAKEKVQSLIASANETTGESDTTLTDAVGTLIDGYGGGGSSVTWENPAATINGTFTGIDTLTVNGSGITTGSMFRYVNGIRHIIMNTPARTNAYYLAGMSDSTLKEFTIVGSTTAWTDVRNLFSGRGGLTKINGTLDFSSVTALGSPLSNCATLQEVRFAPNSIKLSFDPFGGGYHTTLSDESVASIANGLSASNPATITLRCYNFRLYYNIMGDNNNGTFVLNPSGTMTVREFITNVKGWTAVG